MIHLPEYYKDLPRDKSRKYPSIRIFKADWMEHFTHVHPIIPALLWIPIVTWSLIHGVEIGLGWEKIGLGFGVGFLFWTFSEYHLHRFIFHYRPTSEIGKSFCFLMHGIHHADPIDPTRLVMPPFPAIVLATLFFSLFRLIVGPELVFPIFSGFILGYLSYDYVHFAVHHFRPRTRIGKWVKHHHMVHHYVAPESRWGVSTPVFDFIYGTLEVAKKEDLTPKSAEAYSANYTEEFVERVQR